MALLPIPLLPVGGFRVGVKNVGFSSSRFVVGRKAGFISSSSSFRPRVSSGFKAGVSNLSNSSQAEDERVKNEDGGASFLKMWDRAKQGKDVKNEEENWARSEKDFESLLQIPREERDRVQRMQVVDRAAAAIAAVNSLLSEYPNTVSERRNSIKASNAASTAPRVPSTSPKWIPTSVVEVRPQQLSRPRGTAADQNGSPSSARSGFQGTPGPDFWSWVPPEHEAGGLQPFKSALPNQNPTQSVVEKDRTQSSLSIAFETEVMKETGDLQAIFQNRAMPSLPPLQSLLEVDKEKELTTEAQPRLQMPSIDTETASNVTQEIHSAESLSSGVNEDGSRWWQETGLEYRENGVVCKWTTIRGVSADEATEWQEKFWEASDAFDFKELGAEKSGRDSFGRVWHEFWKESMWQDARNGLQHMEKTADKWGKDQAGGEWREKWFEHYDATGYTVKWADKWSKIDSDTPLEPGHAHTWRERWGESFDGQGGTMKYTDKWAERKEFEGWTKWGDKWDDHFDRQGHGIKQGETWWEGTNGEKWNRTWGEGHNGTGWVHKYGRSSSGAHWDTHTQEETWYEQRPHFGFTECFDNSRELRQVNEQRKRQF